MAPSAEEAASRALFASEDDVLQLMDLAEKEEGLHHKGKAPLVEGVDQNFVKALLVEGVDQNFVKAPLVEGVDQISIEENLSVPINAVEEDKICGALMSLACNVDAPSSLTTITSDGSNHRISSTDRDDARRQQLALLAEEANKMPCIGDKEPLSALALIFHQIASSFRKRSRRSSRDGNCFYRSFIFSYLEQAVDMGDEEYEEEALRIFLILQNYKMAFQNLGKPRSLFEKHYSDFIDLLINITEWKTTSTSHCHEQLLLESLDELKSNFIIGLFRLVTYVGIWKRAEYFEPFLFDMKERTLEQFCMEEVIKMGSEVDHLQIMALVDALGVAVSLLNINSSPTLSSSGTLEANRHDFSPHSSLRNQPPLNGD